MRRSRRSKEMLYYVMALPILVIIALVIMSWQGDTITNGLASEGYTNIHLTMKLWNNHPFDLACSGKSPTIRSFQATKNGKEVHGTVCYSVFTGTKSWQE